MVYRVERDYSESISEFIDDKFKNAGGGAGGIDLKLFRDEEGIVHGEYKSHKLSFHYTLDDMERLMFHLIVEGFFVSFDSSAKGGLTKLIGNPEHSCGLYHFPIKKPYRNIRNKNDIHSDIWEYALKPFFRKIMSS